MSDRREIVLFRLVGPGGSHDVMLRPGYGVVMPSRVTSGGSPGIVAQAVVDMFTTWDYRIESAGMEPDIERNRTLDHNFDALYNQLRDKMEKEATDGL